MTSFLPSLLGISRAARVSTLLLGVLAASGCGTEQSNSTPISQARARDDGSTVTVEGAVTVAPATFESAMGDKGFALQDTSGSGIYVRLTEKVDLPLGTRVRVTGKLGEQNKLRLLDSEPASVEKLQGTRQVDARAVRTGEVDESVEGLLIKTSGRVTRTFQDDSPYGYKLYIDDGSGEVQVFVHVSAGFDKAVLQGLGLDQQLTVTGFGAQYETTYEVAPRQPSDLVAQ